MLLLFHHWNNTAEEDEDTITDDTEDMSNPLQKINEADGNKGKEEESNSGNIGKIDMARVDKAVGDDNGTFDGNVIVIYKFNDSLYNQFLYPDLYDMLILWFYNTSCIIILYLYRVTIN